MSFKRATRSIPVLLAIAALVSASCAQQSAQPSAVPPANVQQSAAPAAPAPAAPNLLATNWSQRLGITVSDLKPATGKALISPKAGDVYFFSNSSTAWGATNLKNSVWVIDAKTKQTIAEIAPVDGEGYSSHGITVSGDGRFVYLPMLGKDNHIDVLDGRTFEVVQTIRTLGRPHHMKLWHDANSGKDLMLGEDFNWNFTGSGMYVFDPSQNNAVVGGMSRGDFSGNPYVSTPSPDGKFIVVTVPAPTSAMRDKMDGYLAKVDPKTWSVVGMTAMIDPLWAEVALDGRYAYVTSGALARVFKVDLGSMKIAGEVQTGPGPWGARISYDGAKLYTADKGEGPGYNQQGHTSTIIDLQTLGVTNVVDIGTTTDHAILSPDGSEIWYTSNAEHSIYVLDTATEKTTKVIRDPADGDIHGGVFVSYKSDGKGGVAGAVEADYAGLHNSSLKAQTEYATSPVVTIALNGSGFLQQSVTIPAGQSTRVLIKNVAGTSAGKITFASSSLGIANLTLDPGASKTVKWTAPSDPTAFKATTNKNPNASLTIQVVARPATQTQAPAAGSAIREIAIAGSSFVFNVQNQTIDVKPGETVKFVLTNKDDEKHNIVGLSDAGLLSPDVAPGATVTYQWTAPQNSQTFKVICAYHAQMFFTVNVK